MADDLWHQKTGEKVTCGCGGGPRVPSAKHGRGKRWRARVTDANGKLLQPSFDRKVDAEDFEARTRTDVARGTYVDPDAGKIRLHVFAEEWLESQTFNTSTREAVERRLRLHTLPVLGDMELRVLAERPSAIQAWLRGMTRVPLSDNTIGPIFANLSSILTAALENGLITRNPCRLKSVKAPPRTHKKIRPWSGEQARAIAASLSARYAALAHAGYGLGLRQGECFGLAVEDIPWMIMRPKVHVRRQVKIVGGKLVFAPPKFEHEREVPLAESTKLLLSAHLQQWPARAVTLPWEEPDGNPTTVRLMFRNGRDGAIVRPNFNRDLWQPALIRAGITDAPGREHGFHALRHTYASTQLASGTSIRALAEHLGHTDPAFTLRVYGHLMPEDEDRSRRAIDEAYEDEEMAG